MKRLEELDERELLALAISSEEEDGRVYRDLAEAIRADFPDSARIFEDMAAEESEHRRQLIDLFTASHGPHIPLIQRDDIRGWIRRRPLWQMRSLPIAAVRRQASEMERSAERFYRTAASRSQNAAVRRLFGDLADAEARHDKRAGEIAAERLPDEARDAETANASRRFVLQIVQPGLVGLMDGSVSTLAPVFAAAFATRDPWNAFQVGMAASLGAGISMGFAEALADDGKLSGRGKPLLRGVVCGLMTIAGGIGHTLPYLIHDFTAATLLACIVVVFELLAIAFIQWRYMDAPPLSAAAKVMLGGGLVVLTGVLIGNA